MILHILSLTLLLFTLLFPISSRAAELNPWIHSCYFENDLFTGTDSNYTNGVNLSPAVQDKRKIPKKVLDFIHRKSILPAGIATMDTVEIQLGLVGPESFAENSQKIVHNLRDLQTPNGWDHQLNNEPGIVLAYERKWLFHPHKEGMGGH